MKLLPKPDLLQLDDLIEAHRLAVEDFRRASVAAADSDDEDRAFQQEERSLHALLSYAPATLDDARRRARYLLTTRFFVELDEGGRAYFCSLIPDV